MTMPTSNTASRRPNASRYHDCWCPGSAIDFPQSLSRQPTETRHRSASRPGRVVSEQAHDNGEINVLPHRERFSRREADSRRRVLRRADAARQGELPHHRHPDVDGAVLRQGLRLRQEGGGAGQPRPRRARREGRRRHRRRLRPADRRRDARPVRHRLHPGRRRHLDQHERQRGDRQPRARAPRPQEGRVPVRQPERPRELRPVDQRHLPDRVPPRADPAAGQLHGGAAAAAGGVLRQGPGVRPAC